MKYLSGAQNKLKRDYLKLFAIFCKQKFLCGEVLSASGLRNTYFEKNLLIICIRDLLRVSTGKFHKGEIKFFRLSFYKCLPEGNIKKL